MADKIFNGLFKNVMHFLFVCCFCNNYKIILQENINQTINFKSTHVGHLVFPAVSQHGFGVHAYLQSHLHDASHRPLVRLSSVPGSNAPGIPVQLLGCHQ